MRLVTVIVMFPVVPWPMVRDDALGVNVKSPTVAAMTLIVRIV